MTADDLAKKPAIGKPNEELDRIALAQEPADAVPAPWQERLQPAAIALDQALVLAKAGLPVFPCTEEKRPTLAGGFKNASKDAAVVRDLWQRGPGPLIGVPTGEASGLFVIDLDTSRHPEATDWLDRNAQYLPETRQHRTKSGGFHLFFKHRAGLRNSAGKLAPGVDTRGDGGYVIWWPPCIGGSDHKFRIAAELPQWIVDELTPKPIVYQPRSAIGAVNFGANIRGILQTVTNAPPGQRNQVLHWAACRFGELVADNRITEHQATNLLVHAGCSTGLPQSEVIRTARGGIRRARR
jgi:Bifunctional DNA primase/polymerase, N-terminal